MKKPLPLRPENNHLKYIFIIVRQNVFVHLQNLFFSQISKISKKDFELPKTWYEQAIYHYRTEMDGYNGEAKSHRA
jgi:hypothetical protein